LLTASDVNAYITDDNDDDVLSCNEHSVLLSASDVDVYIPFDDDDDDDDDELRLPSTSDVGNERSNETSVSLSVSDVDMYIAVDELRLLCTSDVDVLCITVDADR
jgi:uncharacterized LabA/DUF88 family protein